MVRVPLKKKRCLSIDAQRPYEFMIFVNMDAQDPYEFSRFLSIDAQVPYENIWFKHGALLLILGV